MQEYDTNKVSLDITILALSSLSEPKWVYSIWTSALW